MRETLPRLEWITAECPKCLRQHDEQVEVQDTDELAESHAASTFSQCPHCGHPELVASLVEYDDDVWRVPGANSQFPKEALSLTPDRRVAASLIAEAEPLFIITPLCDA